jgi:hypothetical protein
MSAIGFVGKACAPATVANARAHAVARILFIVDLLRKWLNLPATQERRLDRAF